ncbi:hypothetical protein SAMN04489859_10208 [Paracoccus alcaliphilus]|uniref:Concanavalin A-like lectin/glucanases superfamily protein n=1 Tax=Paracoccus alcaliphilus TaxID=34002 RepID=A0A1H8K255_9RHOB|nr:hypothetical protein [Paracoccus alcaliphilus]WCR17504.1 hypothetical protein JHW40_14370 [Paracoccus alcaliphilus]SEN87022.1 hypothetical protein SAMN04489859_10208 [Paracoccus alcaliphilus]
MTQKINTIIDRPVTDLRHFTSVLNAEPQVQHMWTAIREKTYRDPTDGLLRIPARKGDIPMAANDDAVEWGSRGRYEVPFFPNLGGSTGRYRATIPNLGNVVSVLLNGNVSQGATEAWSLRWPDGSFWWFQPNRNGSRATANNGSHWDFTANPSPFDQWNFNAVVIDFAAGQIFHSLNNGDFDQGVSPSGGTISMPPAGDVTVWMGEGTPPQPFAEGRISDLAIVHGDVRTMPELMTAWNEYNQTAYPG